MPNNPSPKPSVLKAPWIIEIGVLALVVFQEGFRLESRTNHRTLPVSEPLQRFYYTNFGDFTNGFLNAFLIDGLTDTVLIPILLRLRPKARLPSAMVIASAAALISALIIVAFESRPNSFNNIDLADIPAGVAGAFIYLAVRVTALKMREEAQTQTS